MHLPATFKNKRIITVSTYGALFLLLLLLPACAPTLPLYLEVRSEPLSFPEGKRPGEATLLLAPFSTDKATASAIGELFSWQGSQEIRVDNRALSEGITAKIEANLARRGWVSQPVKNWDGTLAGMEEVGNGRQAILGGTIRLLRINSTQKPLHTVSTLHLVVDCHIGLPQQATLITRSVEVKQEKTHLLQNTTELENLLEEGLEEAAARLAGELNSVLNTPSSK